MRPDQITRMQELEERLLDIYLDEADPGNWPEERGDRVWHKKDAMATLGLVSRGVTLMGMRENIERQRIINAGGGGVETDPDDEEKQRASVEREANALIGKMRKRLGAAS